MAKVFKMISQVKLIAKYNVRQKKITLQSTNDGILNQGSVVESPPKIQN